MILITVILHYSTIGAIRQYFTPPPKKLKYVKISYHCMFREALPGANCGGCGYPSCGICYCVKADSLEGLL